MNMVRARFARAGPALLLIAGGVLLAGAGSSAGGTTPAAGDPVRGRSVYQVCSGCHSLDEDDVGPRHRGVVGRMAGTVPGYAYSAALRDSHIVWTPENLDLWLQDPQKLIPGVRMFFALPNAKDRADVIAFLEQQH